MSALLSTFDEQVIYLDTMLPYALLRGIDPAVKSFFARIEQGAIRAYTSVVTFDELAYRLILALIKDRYGGSPLDRLRDDEEKMLAEYVPAIAPQLRRLRDFPNLTVIEVSVVDVETMIGAMEQYRIRPRDALHFAAMRRVDCVNLASNDQHFDRIPAIRRFAL